jgi:RNA 2',3'-cyclic 3'-phosphodiesterase
VTQSGTNRGDSVAGDEQLRLFIAFPLPAEHLATVSAWQSDALGSQAGRLVAPENLHLTIAFLGTRPKGDVARVAAIVGEAAAAASASELRLVRYRETRSVGMLVFEDPEGGVTACASTIRRGLERLGVWHAERRPWLPHLSVVRFRLPPRLRNDLPALGGVSPSEAAVYMSRLRRGGAQYVVLETAALGG